MNNNQYSSNNNQPSFDKERPINWRKYIFLFLTNWYWFFVTIFIVLSIVYFVNRYSLPVYRASATLLIESEEATSDVLNEIKSVRRQRRTADLANELAKLNAFSLHRRTVDSLNWNIFWVGHGRVAMERPLYHHPPYTIEIDTSSEQWYFDYNFFIDKTNEHIVRIYNKNGIDTILELNQWNTIGGWKFKIERTPFPAGYASYSFIIFNPNTIAKNYRSKVEYSIDEREGTVITISSEDQIADKAINYINTLCTNYIYSGLERKRIIAENTLDFIDEQIKIIQDSLERSEKQMLNFRFDKNVVDLNHEQQLAYNKLQEFYKQRTQLKLKSNYYKYIKQYIDNKRDPQSIIVPTLIDASDELLIEQVNTLQSLYEKREQLTFSASNENPSIIQINAMIQSTRGKILEIINGLIQNNALTRKQIQTEENQVENQLLNFPLSEQELLNIQRKNEVNSQFYTFLLQKRVEAGIQKASTISNVRILDQANSYNVVPVGRKKSIIYLFAFILGLILPGGIIYLADSFDNRIKDRNDIEDHTDIPILGTVTHNISDDEIPVYVKSSDSFAESFRHIRTNLQYILREPDQKIIMITSTISGEGKTFIAINLASILSMVNKKVLLCGMDLRRPSLHKIFNLDNSSGISTYLAGKCELKEIIDQTHIPNLYVLKAGPIPPNPAELLGTNNLSEFFTNVSDLYDYIIIDTPPIALVTDALLISKYSNANIFIIRQNYSPKGVLELINNMKDKPLKELSLLVNDIRGSRALGYRYYYGYGYGYGYSYGYQYEYGNNYYQKDSSD